MYNTHFLPKFFRGKIRVHIMHGHEDPLYNVHESVGACYTWQNTVGLFIESSLSFMQRIVFPLRSF